MPAAPGSMFSGSAPRAPEESPATKSKLREQLQKLRDKRSEMMQIKIPEITQALRDVLEGETAEVRKERMESCIDMIMQLGD